MPTAKPVTKKPVKKKAPAKKAVEAKVEVAAPIEEAAENQAEVTGGVLTEEGHVPGPVEGEAEGIVPAETDVQIVTVVSLSLKTGGNIQFDVLGEIATAQEAFNRIGEILPSRVFIPNPEEDISLIKIDHMTEEEFLNQLQQAQQQPQA